MQRLPGILSARSPSVCPLSPSLQQDTTTSFPEKSYVFRNARIGGGLSSEPKLSRPLRLFVPPERAVDVAAAVASIFRDKGYRARRNHCRLKYLIEDIGERETERLIEEITGPLPHGGRTVVKTWNRGNFYGIHKQKQPGLYCAGLSVTGGVLPAPDFRKIIELSAKYGNGQLRTTNTHHLIILNIPEDQLRDLRKEEILSRYPLHPKAFSGYQASCSRILPRRSLSKGNSTFIS